MNPLLFSKSVYVKRRDKVAKRLKSSCDIVVVLNAPVKRRNHDTSYPYRPDSFFYYLTGFAEPESALLLWREKNKTRSQLFVLPKDPVREQWEGFLYGTEGASKATGISEVFEIGEFSKKLAQALREVPPVGSAPRVVTTLNIQMSGRHILCEKDKACRCLSPEEK